MAKKEGDGLRVEGARDGVFNRLRREMKGGLPSPAGAAYREDIDDPHWLCLERGPGPFFQTFCESPYLPVEAQPRDNVPLTVPARCFLQVG
jgi:hypothetical protein